MTPALRDALGLILQLTLCAVFTILVISKLRWHDTALLTDGTEIVLPSAFEQKTEGDQTNYSSRPNPARIRLIRPGISSIASRIHWLPGLTALVCASFIPFLLAWRWRLLLRALSVSLPYRYVMTVTLKHFPLNLIGFGSASGDVYRAAALRSHTGGWTPVTASLLMDRVFGLIALAIVAILGSSLLITHPFVGPIAAVLSTVLIIGLLGLICLCLVLRSKIFFQVMERSGQGDDGQIAKAHAAKKLSAFIARIKSSAIAFGESIRRISQDSRSVIEVLFISIAAQLLLSVSLWFGSKSIGLSHAFWAATAVVPTATIFALIAPTPQGFGALEWGIVILLGSYEKGGANSCLLLALLFRLMLLCWAIPGTLLWLLPDRYTPQGLLQ